MIDSPRESVRRRVMELSRAGDVVDIEKLTGELSAELDAKSVATAGMLSRIVVQECARLGVPMRLSHADGDTSDRKRSAPIPSTSRGGSTGSRRDPSRRAS